MTVFDITKQLEQIAPKETAESWDHVGLTCGRYDNKVSKVMVLVDVTLDSIEYAIQNNVDLIIAHHPLMFNAVNEINDEEVIGEKLLKLIENHISLYTMHTNFDANVMWKIVADKIGLTNVEVLDKISEETNIGIGAIGDFVANKPVSVKELATLIKNNLSIDGIRVYGDANREITKIAVLPGSGKGFWQMAKAKGANVFVSGDLGHHECLDAYEAGVDVIDATHFGLEKMFIDYIKEYISEKYNEIEIDDYMQLSPYFSI